MQEAPGIIPVETHTSAAGIMCIAGNSDGEIYVTLSGDIDSFEFSQVKEILLTVLSEMEYSRLVLDMTDVDYIDVTTLGALNALNNTIKITLIAPEGNRALYLLNRLGLAQFFHVLPSADALLAAT